MALVIKKRVSLDFLGDEYKEGELIFRSIPAKDLPGIMDKTEGADNKSSKIIPIFIEVLETYFLEGSNDKEPVTKEDIGQLDAESVLHCFQILTGQKIDPKSEGELTSTSSTEAS